MPRYFFNIVDNGRQNDEAGMDLPDAAAARIAGISYAGSVLHHEPHLIDGGRQLCVEVADAEATSVICRIVLDVDDKAGGP